MRLTYTPRARGDIGEIHDWLSERSTTAARDVAAGVRDTAELIAEYPKIGRGTNIEGVRVLPVVRYPYLVYYTIEADEVVIVHVRHGSRDVPQPGEI